MTLCVFDRCLSCHISLDIKLCGLPAVSGSYLDRPSIVNCQFSPFKIGFLMFSAGDSPTRGTSRYLSRSPKKNLLKQHLFFLVFEQSTTIDVFDEF